MEHFIAFSSGIEGISLPEKFTFPFYYDPHELAEIASAELQEKLNNLDIDHNFGLDDSKEGLVIGKMFGVLVVEKPNGELGYLAGFSGKLANTNDHEGFVPPVFDMLKKDGHFRTEEVEIDKVTQIIDGIVSSEEYENAKSELERAKITSHEEIESHKVKMREAKQERKRRRAEEELSEEEQKGLHSESVWYSYRLKDLKKEWKEKLEAATLKLQQIEDEISALKTKRRQMSVDLQRYLFDQYAFLNAENELKSLWDIFEAQPPAGAGECAAPKLLHYAYQNGLRPVALAEFWWGASPKSEVRTHKQYYPSCRGKCEPILGHMLLGLDVDDNPMLQNPAVGKTIETVFEDEHLLVVNKPAEFLSVPGKTISDSVMTRMQEKYPEATGPLIVHRLDMATSGLMLIAKSKRVHKKLQLQFLDRSIKKRYVALLDGEVAQSEGIIDLPLRVDLDDRPRQVVCDEYGKIAKTKWEAIEQAEGKTRVYFYPITGRTHQLRVHAAHSLGLKTPIVGDDLYGRKADRLHLHAESIEFQHPISKERMTIQVDPEF